jgi:hypothetical protein
MSEHASTESSGAEDRFVIDLGVRSGKQVKLLRKGRGRLLEEVDECIAELRSTGLMPATGQVGVVVVTVQEEAVHRPGASMMLFPGFPPLVVPGGKC